MAFDWKHVRHFTPEQFDDPLYPGSGINISGVLILELEQTVEWTGYEIVPHWEVGGCVDMKGEHGHGTSSYHCKFEAIDFHFKTDDPTRVQYHKLVKRGFTGMGVYYDWKWDGVPLPIGFHVDIRPVKKTQLWKRINGKYIYFLK